MLYYVCKLIQRFYGANKITNYLFVFRIFAVDTKCSCVFISSQAAVERMY
jgi:hypothetical protein